MATTSVKKSDSFVFLMTLPTTYADGYFFNFTPRAQMRTKKYGNLIAELSCGWVDEATTRKLNIQCIDTSDWPVGDAVMDVQFKRQSDGYTISTETIGVTITKDITQ